MQEAVSDRAWLQAMLDVESALASAEARAGVIPARAAAEIAACCRAERFDVDALGRGGRGAANPVVSLVRALTDEVTGDAARYVHWGATSQDVLDTASMLVARRALDVILADLAGVAAACAALADAHRETLMAGRTLLQQAVPITFGLKAAGWLAGVAQARRRLLLVRTDGLAVELGGAAGSIASLGCHGVTVLAHLAEELDLAEPPVPWHTARLRVADLGAALGLAAGALAKVALDVTLLSQTEVAEVAESSGGGSSTMPHKRNPVEATIASACARRVHGLAGVLLASMTQEHERAAGAWQAEWETLRDALALTGGAAASMRKALEGLEIRPARMRANLDASGGLLLAERVAMAIAGRLGRLEAHRVVAAACDRAVDGEGSFRHELLADSEVGAALSATEIDRLLDPAGYLGSSDALIDRALEAHRRDAQPE